MERTRTITGVLLPDGSLIIVLAGGRFARIEPDGRIYLCDVDGRPLEHAR